MSEPIRAREVRLKSFREYLLDFENPSDERTNFVYCDTGEAVAHDALVVPWKDDFPEEKLSRLEDILGNYADSLGWDYMSIGDEL